ncbi:MAG: anticodon-binding protein, partial [Actinobacteria bacterium]|nr:anticodon-binding protein [Actinomycetota bacterium]
DHAVTVRDRDTMEQQRVPIAGLVEHLRAELGL